MASTYLKLPLAGDNLGEVGEDILPVTDATYDIGSSSLRFVDGFLDRVIFGVGSESAPSVTFEGDEDTGFYRSAPNIISASFGGSRSLVFAATSFVPAGDVSVALGNSSNYFNTAFVGQTDSGTTTILDVLTIKRITSGTAAAGLGCGILLQLEDDGGNLDSAGRVSTVWTDATGGSEDSAITFQVRTAGAALAESFRLTATQVLSLAGDGSAAAPTYSFTTYPGAGMLANTGGTLIAYGGNQIARFGSDDIQFNHGGASIWLFGATYFKPSTHMVGALGATDAYLNTGFIGCSDAGTTTTLDALTLRRDTSGTAAAGLGCGLLFRLEANDANPGDAARVAAVWTDATFTTKDADIVFSAMKANTMTEGARVKGTGGIICPAGSTEALPSFGISTSGGMFEYSSNVIGFATGGTLRFRVAAAGITTSVALLPNTARTEAVGSSSAPMGPSFLGATDSGTTTTLDALTLSRSTSGTAGVALGCGLLYELEDAGGNMESAARIATVWTDATNATEDSAITFATKTAGAALAEAARLVGLQWRMSNGSASLPSYSFTNFTSSGWYADANGINHSYSGVSGGYWSADDVLFKMGTVSTHYFDGTSYQPSTDLLTTLGIGTKRFSAGYIASINSADSTKKFEVNNTGVGFFAATPVAKQASAANLTNNVTAGGTDDTIADFSSLTVYATDAAAIRNDIYQLARKLKQVNDALRLYGLLT